jgi:hypothetical protein
LIFNKSLPKQVTQESSIDLSGITTHVWVCEEKEREREKIYNRREKEEKEKKKKKKR